MCGLKGCGQAGTVQRSIFSHEDRCDDVNLTVWYQFKALCFVFQMMDKLGVGKTWRFVDVLGLEAEQLKTLPKECCALMLLFPLTPQVVQYWAGGCSDVSWSQRVGSYRMSGRGWCETGIQGGHWDGSVTVDQWFSRCFSLNVMQLFVCNWNELTIFFENLTFPEVNHNTLILIICLIIMLHYVVPMPFTMELIVPARSWNMTLKLGSSEIWLMSKK